MRTADEEETLRLAKRLMMNREKVTEPVAHYALQHAAMDRRVRMVVIAKEYIKRYAQR